MNRIRHQRTPLTSQLLAGQEFLCPDYSFFIKSPHSYQVLVIYVVTGGTQECTESKARLPDSVTLAKNLQLSMQLPHLENEDNSICLRNVVINQLQKIQRKLCQAYSKCSDTQGTRPLPNLVFLPQPQTPYMEHTWTPFTKPSPPPYMLHEKPEH